MPLLETKRSAPGVSFRLLSALPAYTQPAGLDFEGLLSEHGITPAPADDMEAEAPLNAVARLFETVAARLGDPCFGLHYAEVYPPGRAGALGYILLHAATNRVALRSISRYAGLVIWPLHTRFHEQEDVGILTWRYPADLSEPHYQFNCFLTAGLILLLRIGTGSDWIPQRIDCEYREDSCKLEMLRIVGRNICFNQSTNRIVFQRSVLDRRRALADANLYPVVKHLGDIMLAARGDTEDLISRVQAGIADHLGTVPATLQAIAKALNVSPRALQRALRRRGTSYSKLVSDTRRATAERLLRNTELPMTEIAFLLGYSELSAFTRAAHDWFGVSPRAFRIQSRLEE